MIIFCGVALLASCKKDQLELYPYNQIETSQAFNTEADVTLALNGLYSGLRGMYAGDVANIMGDDCLCAGNCTRDTAIVRKCL